MTEESEATIEQPATNNDHYDEIVSPKLTPEISLSASTSNEDDSEPGGMSAPGTRTRDNSLHGGTSDGVADIGGIPASPGRGLEGGGSLFPPTTLPPEDQVVSWSKTLQSPTLPTFSPAVEQQSKTTEKSHHGTGLNLSLQRSRQLNKTTHRCLVILQELTSLYAQYAVALNKAGQMLPAPTNEMMNAAHAAGGLSDPVPLVPLQKAIAAWAKDKSKVASQVRNAIAPLMNYLAAHMDSIGGVHQRYKDCRHTCISARNRALRAHLKYLKAVRECEQLLAELKSRDTGTGASTAPSENAGSAGAAGENATTTGASGSAFDASMISRTPGRPPKRLENKLKEALKDCNNMECRYKLRVQWENDSVDHCQSLEGMALETMQKIEEDRLSIFVSTLVKIVAAQKQALESGVMSLASEIDLARNKDSTTGNGETAEGEEKNPAQKLYKMFTGSNSFAGDEEPNGAMDAETLGLPEEVGHLRDRVRSRLAARRERIQLAKTLSLFFENIVKASTKLGQSLLATLKKENIHHNETLRVAMTSCEGAHVRQLWDGMTKFIESEAEGCFAMADSLRNVRAAKLDSVILYGEKALKTTSESDDAAWKQLCEAARTQGKAETKYRQSSLESAKARERVLSMDSKSQLQMTAGSTEEKEGGGREKPVIGRRVQKGFQSFMAQGVSLLPDGGDKAMKLLNPSARSAHAQRGLKDADEKEAKEKQQLVAATEATSAALAVYKADAEHIISRYDVEEKEGWNDIKTSIDSFAQLAQKLLGSLQLEAISDLQHIAAQSHTGMAADINEWRMKAQQELVAICVDCTVADDSAVSGFRLEVNLITSNAIDEYRQQSLGDGDVGGVSVDDLSVDDDLDDDDGEEAKAESSEGTPVAQPEQPVFSAETNNAGKTLFRRQLLPPSSQAPGGPTRGNGLKLKGRRAAKHPDAQTDLFLTYFWPDPADANNVPVVLGSYPCSFRDATQKLPSQYGRVFLSSNRIVFTSWTKKKLNLRWEEIRDIKPGKSFDSRRESALLIFCKRADSPEDSCMVLDGFFNRQAALDDIEKLKGEAHAASEAAACQAREVSIDESGGAVAPDTVLQQMKIVVSKHLKNITIERFHLIVWSEKEKPLFRPWLEKECFDIEFSDWKSVRNVGPWCKETYNDQRIVKFRVKRKTHLYIGPPIANVTQTHRCRIEGNDRCVTQITIEFEGIPYSDSFAVEVRWVATRVGNNDIKVECGLAVDFRKKNLFKKQIQAGTIEESTPVHRDFFKTMQAACIAAGGVEGEEGEEPEVEEPSKAGELSISGLLQTFQEKPYFIHVVSIVGPLVLFGFWRLFFYGHGAARADLSSLMEFNASQILEKVCALEAKIDALQSSLDELVQAIKETRADES